MYYVFENDKPNKYNQFIRRIFNYVEIDGNKIEISSIPKLKVIVKENGQKVAKRRKVERRKKTIEKIAKKTTDILNRTNCNKVVLSKRLKEEKEYINYLYSKNLDVVDGKFLFSLLAPEALKYILKKINIDEKDLKIAILVNNLNEISIRKYKKYCKEL